MTDEERYDRDIAEAKRQFMRGLYHRAMPVWVVILLLLTIGFLLR